MAALKQRPYAGPASAPAKTHTKPEWECAECGVTNFMDRQCCRRCKAPARSERTGPVIGHRLPAGSVWAEADPKTAAARATALEKAAAAARAAGASNATAEALAADAAEAKREAVSCKPLGARIDSARAKLRRAEAKTTSSREALEKAKASHAEACTQRDEAKAELEVLEKECAMRGSSTPDGRMCSVLNGARELLLKLEGSPLVSADTHEPPEPLLAAMRVLHAAIAEAAPEPELEMSLDEEEMADHSAPAERASSEARLPEASYRGAFAGSASGTAAIDFSEEDVELGDAELAALVRERLSKRRRANPY